MVYLQPLKTVRPFAAGVHGEVVRDVFLGPGKGSEKKVKKTFGGKKKGCTFAAAKNGSAVCGESSPIVFGTVFIERKKT